MPKIKVAVTLEASILNDVDELVGRGTFRNRSQAVESALVHALQRLQRTRLAREAARLRPAEERRIADEGLTDALASWPEY